MAGFGKKFDINVPISLSQVNQFQSYSIMLHRRMIAIDIK